MNQYYNAEELMKPLIDAAERLGSGNGTALRKIIDSEKEGIIAWGSEKRLFTLDEKQSGKSTDRTTNHGMVSSSFSKAYA